MYIYIYLSLPLFPFIRGEVLPATSSPPYLLFFSTLLCLLSSPSSLPPLLSSSHPSLHSPPISVLAFLIERVVRHGSIIHSDQWAAYRQLSANVNYTYATVNHSVNFVDPVTGVHTQAIESYWAKAKNKFKAMKGVATPQLSGYLDERMWRDRYAPDATAAFHHICSHIHDAYPV